MLLNGNDIVRMKLIDHTAPASVRAVSYDLRIGTILAKNEHQEVVHATPEFWLPPQGMVEVISMEKVTLPRDISGHAMVKTGLSEDCVLALGIGLIDPGYDGYISSTLVNFGTQKFRLANGNVFLRLTFEKYDPAFFEVKINRSKPFEEYLEDKRSKVLYRFSQTFLNIDHTVRAALRPKLFEFLAWAGGLALLIALVTAAASIGIGMLGSHLVPFPGDPSTVKELHGEYIDLQKQLADTQKALADAQKRLRELQEKNIGKDLKAAPPAQ